MTSSETPYRFEDGDGHSVVALLPGLNESPWAAIEKVGDEVLERLNARPAPAFLIDLSALDYMGSATVALIVRIWKSTKDRNGRMVIVNQHEMVYEVLKLAGLHTLWNIVESRDEARQQLMASDRSQGGWEAVLAIVVGVLALLGAAGGLYVLLFPMESLDERAALGIELGCSAVALIAGIVSAIRQRGGRRVFGCVVIAASLGLTAAGIVNWPDFG